MKTYEVPTAQLIEMRISRNVADDIVVSSEGKTTPGGDTTWTRGLNFDDEVSDYEE